MNCLLIRLPHLCQRIWRFCHSIQGLRNWAWSFQQVSSDLVWLGLKIFSNFSFAPGFHQAQRMHSTWSEHAMNMKPNGRWTEKRDRSSNFAPLIWNLRMAICLDKVERRRLKVRTSNHGYEVTNRQPGIVVGNSQLSALSNMGMCQYAPDMSICSRRVFGNCQKTRILLL